jgi:hypothetical protein
VLLIQQVFNLNIRCDFHNIQWVFVGSVYTCRTLELTDMGNKRLENVQGNHLAGKGNQNVKAIDFYESNELSFFPENIHGHFPNLLLQNETHTTFVG